MGHGLAIAVVACLLTPYGAVSVPHNPQDISATADVRDVDDLRKPMVRREAHLLEQPEGYREVGKGHCTKKDGTAARRKEVDGAGICKETCDDDDTCTGYVENTDEDKCILYTDGPLVAGGKVWKGSICKTKIQDDAAGDRAASETNGTARSTSVAGPRGERGPPGPPGRPGKNMTLTMQGSLASRGMIWGTLLLQSGLVGAMYILLRLDVLNIKQEAEEIADVAHAKAVQGSG